MPQYRISLYYATGETFETDAMAEVIIAAPSPKEAAVKARAFIREHHPEFDDSKWWAWVSVPNPGGKSPERVS